ncbi:hypothetical protein D3C72_2004000 [compost metagenome]
MRLGHRFPVFACGGVGLGGQHGGNLDVTAQHEAQRRVRQRRGFLGDAGDADLAGQVDVTLVGLQLALHRREQAGLASAVAADHAYPVTGMQSQVDIGQQQPLAAAQGEITKRNHGGRRPYNRMECAGKHCSCDAILTLTNT